MSDTPQSNERPAAASILQDVECPSCGSRLRNVVVQAGQALHCLNCGKRFSLNAAQTLAQPPAAAPQTAAVAREPGSPGYWLLRAPAIVACAAGWFFFLFLIAHDFPSNFRALYECSYQALLPLGGSMLLVCATLVARIDRQWVQWMWAQGRLAQPLPAAPGSSLPFVAPLAAAGGVMPFAGLFFHDEVEATLTLGLIGAGLFYISFALEDVRQFIWRQEQMARSMWAQGQAPQRQPFGLSGWLLGGAAFAFGAMLFWPFLDLLVRHYDEYYPYERIVSLAAASFTLLLAALPLYLLGRAWDGAVHAWDLAAKQAQPCRPASLPSQASLLDGIPFLTSVYCVLWMFSFLDGHRNVLELLIGACLTAAVVLLACAMGYLLMQFRRWHAAQASVLGLQPGAALSAGPQYIFVSALLLLGLQSLLCLWLLIEMLAVLPTGLELMGLPLLYVALHYPTLWFALLVVQLGHVAALPGSKTRIRRLRNSPPEHPG